MIASKQDTNLSFDVKYADDTTLMFTVFKKLYTYIHTYIHTYIYGVPKLSNLF